MKKSYHQSESRSHRHQLEIAASPEAVWKAITQAEQLANWFPIEAEVEPGPGGRLTYSWGKDHSGSHRIEVWNPPHHLRTTWEVKLGEDEADRQLMVDWFIEGTAGGSRLRLVHSGFEPGVDWDEDFTGTQRGWSFELLSLKHYLEHQAGGRRQAFLIRQPVETDAETTWNQVFGAQGLAPWKGSPVSQSSDVRFTLASGDPIQGRLLQWSPPTDFSCLAGNLNGLLRIKYESYRGHRELNVWLSLWGATVDQARKLETRLRRAVKQSFA